MSKRLVIGLLLSVGAAACSSEGVEAPRAPETTVAQSSALAFEGFGGGSCSGGFGSDDFGFEPFRDESDFESMIACDEDLGGWDDGFSSPLGGGVDSATTCSQCQTTYTSCMNNALGCPQIAMCRGDFITCTDPLPSCSRPVVHDICKGS